MKRLGQAIGIASAACVVGAAWTIWHGGTVTQFVLLGLTGILLGFLSGYISGLGR